MIMSEEEIWKDIKGYEDKYQVSNLGRIKSLKDNKGKSREIFLKFANNKQGYPFVNLYKDNKVKLYRVHRLVAEAFIPNPENLPQVNHINGKKTDNRVDNLEWCTQKENIGKAWKFGLCKSNLIGNVNKRKKVAQIDLQNNVIKIWNSVTEASKTLNINATSIAKCARGEKHYNIVSGFKWKYLLEILDKVKENDNA